MRTLPTRAAAIATRAAADLGNGDTPVSYMAAYAVLHRVAADVDAALRAEFDAREDELLAEIARLRDALRPFAEQFRILESNGSVTPDGDLIHDFQSFELLGGITAFTVGDCRAAAQALRG